ncbi:uncharacterized protein [Typha latifolia]|uniref:uncharacterized protein n=1 Tax=Typha latifolia TaxID=4733 RepID=UPI003C2F520C
MDLRTESLASSNPTSPRISFSHDLSYSDRTPTEPNPSPSPSPSPLLDSASVDFHFKPGADFPLPDPSPADSLFSNGRLLPSPLLHPKPPPPPTARLVNHSAINLRQLMDSTDEGATRKGILQPPPFSWFGRSRTLSCRRRPRSSGTVCPSPLLRSKSAGSNTALVRNSTQRRLAYSDTNCNGLGVRPILNVDITSTSVLSYLLCKCGSKSMKVEG